MTLQEHILLRFHKRESWSTQELSQALEVPFQLVADEVRYMAHVGWFRIEEGEGDIAVGIIPRGKAELEDLIERIRQV